MIDDPLVDRLPGLHELSSNLIGRDDMDTMGGEHLRHGAFTTAQSAGEAYAQHRLDSETTSQFCRPHGIRHEHGDSERTDPSWNRRVGARKLKGRRVHVAHNG